MPFVEDILRYRSLSIVGLEKNTGKTVCLNYVLRRLHEMGVRPAVTSVGVDGEQVDVVYGSAKPEVRLFEGSLFITSEQHYRQRRVVSMALEVSRRRTSLGRLVTAQVVCGGTALISGPSSTPELRRQLERLSQRGAPITLVDGALGRLSLASPAVSEAMILATGAAVSASIPQLVQRTRHVYNLICLEQASEALCQRLLPIERGLWGVDDEGMPHDLHAPSALLLDHYEGDLLRHGATLFAAGMVNDRLLRLLARHSMAPSIRLVARDFTKIFATPPALKAYEDSGARLLVLQRSALAAITLNPWAPRGYSLRSEEACQALQEAIGVPVYDVMRQGR